MVNAKERVRRNGVVPTVWNPRYSTDAAHTNSTRKQAEVVRLALGAGLLDLQSVPFRRDEVVAEIEDIHAPSYVKAVLSGTPRSVAESQGFTWSPAFAKAVLRIWAGHVGACQLAMKMGLVFHPVSGAHHARHATGAGFCTFNFLSGAARVLLRDGLRRIAVVDLDAHQGDGTYDLEASNPGVALFDIAGQAWTLAENNDRIQFHVVPDAEAYREALMRLPAFLDRVKPDLVQYQAGMDPYQGDYVGGIQDVGPAFLKWRDAFVIEEVRSRGIPLVVNLAGGYVDRVTVRLHLETVRTMAGQLAHEEKEAM